MAATGTVSISGSVTGLSTGSKTIGPLTITSSAAVGQQTDVTLASGDNTITVPSTSTAAIIVFDATSTTTKKIKGAGGDTGITVTKTGKFVLHFDTAAVPASFIINSSVADTGKTTSVLFV